MFRAKLTTPRPALVTKSSMPGSILKRPSPLLLSPTSDPFPFATSLTILHSPTMLSPHVHFPPTPGLVTNHDHAITPICPPSPQRVPVDASLSSDDSDTVTSDSPSKSKPRMAVRFGNHLSQTPLARNSQDELDKSFSSFPYPVSPYPRSPLPSSVPSSPIEDKENHADMNGTTKGARCASTGLSSRVSKKSKSISAPARVVRGEMRASRQNTLHVPSPYQFGAPQVSSPLLQSETFNILVESPPAPSTKPTPMLLDLEPDSAHSGGGSSSRLRSAFWKSVSLSDTHEQENVKSHTYRLSAVEEASPGDSTPASAVPPFLFGRKDGTLWSPGLPRKQSPVEVVADSFLSPTAKVSFGEPSKSAITSPLPNDPFSAFPSFSAAITRGGEEGAITYPPPVIVQSAGDR